MKKSNTLKKVLSLVLTAMLVVTSVPVIVSAETAQEPQALSLSVDPENGASIWNETVTFTVTTNTAASRVKITYADGSTHYAVSTENGFDSYTDKSGVRTWTITKRAEIMGLTGFRAYAGNSDYGYTSAYAEAVGTPVYVAAESIQLSKSELTLKTNATAELTAVVLPANATDRTCKWQTSDSSVATVENGIVKGVASGTATITAVSNDNSNLTATCTVTVSDEVQQTEPPYPFWKDYTNYSDKDTYVYYYGKIYKNNWYSAAGTLPTEGEMWELVGDAEWTVEEKESNYTKGTDADSENKILTDSEIEELYGGINEEYSPEAALGRLEELIPQDDYEELFPYRFGSELWKSCSATKDYYADPSSKPDYYSYENLQSAVEQLANVIIKVQWYQGAAWCYRIIRLDKTTKEQIIVYEDEYFHEDWLTNNSAYTLRTAICDYGSFIATGDLNTRKRELAAFLANISHETGGGTIDGTVEVVNSGLYFNEEVGLIGTTAENYVQSTGTQYLPVAGKSYHGRGPIQLSYNYNYGLCSQTLFGDASILLNEPEKLVEDGVLGFMTGIWFWMTPQPPKPSCHQVITGTWEPVEGENNIEYNGNFGLTIVIINAETGQSESGVGAVARRAMFYRAFCAKMSADITGEQCDTMGMVSFTT